MKPESVPGGHGLRAAATVVGTWVFEVGATVVADRGIGVLVGLSTVGSDGPEVVVVAVDVFVYRRSSLSHFVVDERWVVPLVAGTIAHSSDVTVTCCESLANVTENNGPGPHGPVGP